MTEKKMYEVVYPCLNCKTPLYLMIPWGEAIPILSEQIPENPYAAIGTQVAPECTYCGCRQFGYGKKP